MKKNILLSVILAIVLATGCLTACNRNGKNSIPELLERNGTPGPASEAAVIKQTYDKAVAALKENPDDIKQDITLASVFITEGRITGNGGYYSNAAVKMLDRALNTPGIDNEKKFEALSLKSAVLLNMHQFKDALAAAQQGETLNNFNSGIYGALVDANVELGHYDEAVKDCDKMLGLRPDLRSYSRASYLRQIYGDNTGAIAAMKMAVDAGIPGEESTEWARVNLGDLYLNIGNTDSADIIFRTALVYRPGYPFAEMGMSRVACALKKYDEAITHDTLAIKVMSEAAFISYLGELYALKGDTKKTEEIRTDVINQLVENDRNQPTDAIIKHNAHREMAMAYMNAGKLDDAIAQAKVDLDMRPDNIDANELMGWLKYLKGDYAGAKANAEKTLKTHTKNANTLYKAGVIYIAAGDTAAGNDLLQQARAVTPYIDQRLINQTKK